VISEYTSTFADVAYSRVARAAADARSMDLLRGWLTPEQREQLAKHRGFEVVGNKTGTTYWIGADRQAYNIRSNGQRYCLVPDGTILPRGDILLTQKIALECDEAAALQLANAVMSHWW
jgi:hypothetical protein